METDQLPSIPYDRYFESRLKDIRDFIELQISALIRSIDLAHVAMEKRLDVMNEFRESLRDTVAKTVTRTEWEKGHDQVEKDVAMLRESKANLEGKASQFSVNIAMIFAILATLLSGVSLIVNILHK